jgi:hypothetical protein
VHENRELKNGEQRRRLTDQKKKVERERLEAEITSPCSEDEETPQETEKQKREKARYRNKKSYVLQENVKGVNFFYIEDTDIDTVSNELDLTKVKAFPGTMQVHQVSSVNSSQTHLVFRTLSHFGVHLSAHCHNIGSLKYLPFERRAYYSTIYSDSDDDGNVEDVMNDSEEEHGAESGGREGEHGAEIGGFEEEYESDDEVLNTLYEAFKMKK